jgi:hypothetical protein
VALGKNFWKGRTEFERWIVDTIRLGEGIEGNTNVKYMDYCKGVLLLNFTHARER